jgi:hypothetical protein
MRVATEQVTKGKSTEKVDTGNSADKRARQLAGLRPFPPGQSGNPNGRPVIPPEVKRIFEAALPETARELVRLAKEDPDPVVRLKAIDMIHNRLLGKPTQQVDANVTTTNVQQAHLAVLIELQQKREAAMKTIEARVEENEQDPEQKT